MKRVAHGEPKPLSRLRHFPGTPTLSPPFSLVTLSRFGLTPFRSHPSSPSGRKRECPHKRRWRPLIFIVTPCVVFGVSNNVFSFPNGQSAPLCVYRVPRVRLTKVSHSAILLSVSACRNHNFRNRTPPLTLAPESGRFPKGKHKLKERRPPCPDWLSFPTACP